MAYLGLALYAEGPTDHRFFGRLLPRVVEDVYLDRGERPLEIGDVVALFAPPGGADGTREAKIAAAAKEKAGTFHVLFVHADGGARPGRVRDEQVDPGLSRAMEELGRRYAGVGVVPVREMEAWAIADGDALRVAFRTTLSDDELGIPLRPRDCEKVADPKAVLEAAFRKTLRGSRGKGAGTAAGSLQLIAEAVSLSCLAGLPSFQALRADVELALHSLGLIH